jgi:hypothetical protein
MASSKAEPWRTKERAIILLPPYFHGNRIIVREPAIQKKSWIESGENFMGSTSVPISSLTMGKTSRRHGSQYIFMCHS